MKVIEIVNVVVCINIFLISLMTSNGIADVQFNYESEFLFCYVKTHYQRLITKSSIVKLKISQCDS